MIIGITYTNYLLQL